MEYSSIRQYFYKFHSALFLLVLIPILVFITIYFTLPDDTLITEKQMLIIALASVNAIDWVAMFVLYFKKIKSIRNAQGLGLKLDKYFSITIVRFSMIVFTSMTLAAGLYLTHEDIFTGLFIGNLVLLSGLWPTSSRVCSDLRLRGAEREMVFYKKDRL